MHPSIVAPQQYPVPNELDAGMQAACSQSSLAEHGAPSPSNAPASGSNGSLPPWPSSGRSGETAASLSDGAHCVTVCDCSHPAKVTKNKIRKAFIFSPVTRALRRYYNRAKPLPEYGAAILVLHAVGRAVFLYARDMRTLAMHIAKHGQRQVKRRAIVNCAHAW